MNDVLEITTLGKLEIRRGGEPVTDLDARKVQALLVYLACTRRPHSRDVLADLLWDDLPQQRAMGNLRVVLHGLRKHLEPYVSITRDSVALNPEATVWLDAAEMERAVSRGRLEDAAELYQSDFLTGFYVRGARGFEDWALAERERLRQLALDALGELVAQHLDAGAFKAGIPHARRLVLLDPYLEAAHRQLMRLLAHSGQRGAALAAYEACRKVLAEELNLEPAEESVALYRQIQAGELAAPTRRDGRPVTLRAVRGYELQERIGAGGFGEVYRAYQPSVGRQVAIKVILPQYANQPEFIRRFEREAQLVARLEHPHIVPLHDYWREPDGAYLVMRWLRGGNLYDALQRGPWIPEVAANLLDQMAGALTVAHRQGVVHRDIKPENIMLDQDGNAYLTDFGIAKDLLRAVGATQTDAVPGSLLYISPEQAQSQPVTPQSDIYSLGVVMYEVLTGSHPYSSLTPADQLIRRLTEPLPPLREQRPDLPEALERVIQQATARDATDRYPDAQTFAKAFREAVSPTAVTIAPTPNWAALEMVNPYKGLRPFEEADAADFFGREVLIQQLLKRLTPSLASPSEEEHQGGHRFLAVVGPSGSGKSSVVKAGLLPVLRRGALPGSEDWFIVEMLPGAHPLDELEIGLMRVAINPFPGLMEQLQRDERGLLRATRLVLPPEATDAGRSELLLVIDQFEELFTRTTDRDESEHLLQLLYAAVCDPRSRVLVIITLRADFYDRPLLHPKFSQLMRQHTAVVVPLTAEELASAIREPALRVGAELEPGLVTAIVTDVSEQPGALPMLQYAVTELFERRDGRTLTRAAYQAIGGVSGALARRAEETFEGLDADGREMARQLFLRLVTLGEGASDAASAPDTRRRVLRSELEVLTMGEGQASAIDKVVEVYGRHRLLTFDRDPVTREPTVEVAHEALLREWGRLRGWLDENRADIRLQRLLASASGEWLGADRDPGFLLRGARLDRFEDWAESAGVALTQDERAYLDASLAARRARQAEEAARRQRELEQVSVGLAAQAVAELAGDAPERGVLLALEALELYPYTPQAERALAQTVYEMHRYLTIRSPDVRVSSAAFSPDGTRIATTGYERFIYIWDSVSGEMVARINDSPASHKDEMTFGVDWSSDGRTLFTSSTLLEIARVWNIDNGDLLLIYEGHSGAVNAVNLSSDDGLALTSSSDGSAHIWQRDTGSTVQIFTGHEGSVTDAVWSPDDDRIVTASADGTVRIWDVRSGSELLVIPAHSGGVLAVAWSPDGTLIASAGNDGLGRVWDVETGTPLFSLIGHDDLIRDIEWSPDGTSWPQPVGMGQHGSGKRLPAASCSPCRVVTRT